MTMFKKHVQSICYSLVSFFGSSFKTLIDLIEIHHKFALENNKISYLFLFYCRSQILNYFFFQFGNIQIGFSVKT